MAAESRRPNSTPLPGQLTRRAFLRRATIIGLSGAALPAFLAACGASSTVTAVAPTVAARATTVAPTVAAAGTSAASGGVASTAAAAATQVATAVPGGIVGTAQAAATNPAGAATAIASAVGGPATPGGAGTPAAKYTGPFDGTILFGAPISLTGGTAKEGGLTRDGYDIWKETYNDRGGIMVAGKRYKIETKYYDDESNAQKSATLAEKLLKEDGAKFLLGPYGTSATLQVSTVAEKAKIPMIEGNGAAESIFSQGYQYTFGVLSPAKNYLRGVIDMALTLTPKPATVVILTADDAFSVEVADAAKKACEESGLQVVYYQKYPNNSTDLRAPLTETKGKNPDLFLNSGHLAESLAIMQQAKELGFNAKGYAFSVGPSIPDFQTTLKNDANFVFGGTQWTPALKYKGDDPWGSPAAYNDAYKARFNYEPAYQSAESTACGIAYVKALEKAGGLDPKTVRDAIAKLDFVSFYGQIKFDDRGINTFKPMAVEQWQNGQKVTVWPADVANAKPAWPTPAWGSR